MQSKFQQYQGARKQGGFNMIELMIVIAVILLLTAGIFTLYRNVSAGQRTDASNKQLLGIVTGIHQINPSPSYGAAGTDVGKLLVQSGKAPADMTAPTAPAITTLTNSWGGTVTALSSTYAGGAAGNSFTITFPNVPTSECVSILSAQGNAFVSMGTDTTALVKDQATGVSPTSATIVPACVKASNILTFVSN